MTYYPIFLKLENQRCLVVGAGEVGLRKLKSILESNPLSVLVIDTSPASEKLKVLLSDSRVKFEQREFIDADIKDKFLIIASTCNHELNKHIANLCTSENVLCNIADLPEKSNFIVPSVVKKGDLALAISTGGCSPAFTRKIRKDLDNFFGDQYAKFIEFMGRLRPLVLDLGNETRQNTILFRKIVESPLLNIFETDDRDHACVVLIDLLPKELHSRIPELLNDLI